MDTQVLKTAMDMALEWGENFHKPIQQRLRTLYPALSQAEADTFDSLCREIRDYAFTQIERAYVNEITGAEATANITARYPLLHADTLARLWSQGQYYAWHDNG
jgi:hypothetical protein